jgi:hypothetical protein
MVAKNVLLGGKKGDDGGLPDKVTGAYKRWYDRLIIAVKTAMPNKSVFSPTEHPLTYIGGGDGSMVLDHEFVIVSKALDYSLHFPY